MNERCLWVASDKPRVLRDRHAEDCSGDGCRGCLPCGMTHCRCCGITHAEGACPGCLAEVRGGLAEIVRMYAALPEEVEHRGIEGEAMALLGPAADPEAWGHVEASVASGRLPKDWQVELGQHHPLTVLASWQDVYADAFDQQVTRRATVLEAAAWLNGQLTRAGEEAWVPFDEFARDVRQCATHLERVLHDGEQVDQGAPCLRCHKRLVRIWGFGGKEDLWECRTCHETSNDTQYAIAMKDEYIKNAAWLTDADMVVRVSTVTASTVRSWASDKDDRPSLIRKKLHSQRTVYNVEDVQWIDACRREGQTAA